LTPRPMVWATVSGPGFRLFKLRGGQPWVLKTKAETVLTTRTAGLQPARGLTQGCAALVVSSVRFERGRSFTHGPCHDLAVKPVQTGRTLPLAMAGNQSTLLVPSRDSSFFCWKHQPYDHNPLLPALTEHKKAEARGHSMLRINPEWRFRS